MKKHKKLIIAVLILILSSVGIFAVDFGVQSYVVMNYLCQKYDAKATDFKFVKYTPEYYRYMTPESSFPLDFRQHSPLWEFEYNDVIFNVQKLKPFGYKYYDDYQLEEVSLWSTEYLSKNIDENIIGTHASTNDFYRIAQDNEYYRTHRFTQDGILDYINEFNNFPIYYRYDCDIYRYCIKEVTDSVEITKVNDSINNSNDIQFVIIALKSNNVTNQRTHKKYDSDEFGYYYALDEFNSLCNKQ